MDIAWPTLIRVRERHRHAAQQAVAQERRLAAACEAQLAAADARWQQELALRTALWQRLRESQDGAVNVAQLLQASVWSRTLDLRIARAAETVAEARRSLVQQQQRVDTSRQRLRQAASELDKAERMQERQLADQRRQAELRRDDASEESATQGWLQRGR